jgi:hypothetical protein
MNKNLPAALDAVPEFVSVQSRSSVTQIMIVFVYRGKKEKISPGLLSDCQTCSQTWHQNEKKHPRSRTLT